MEKKPATRSRSWHALRGCLIWAYSVAALTSLATLAIFWCTNVFRDAIVSELALRNGTQAFDWWQRPPLGLSYRVYVFNYTNTEEFEAGRAAKLRVQEVGPYVYKETLARVNARFHENGTVTYQEKRSFRWEGGTPDDETVVVPNVPLFTAITLTRDMNFFTQVLLTATFSALRATTFVRVPAGGLIWGYDDQIFEKARSLLALKHRVPDKFGLLALKSGVSEDRITMHTGVGSPGELGMIQRVNGMDRKNVWSDEKCDKIEGTDGSMFPPHMTEDRDRELKVYAMDMCRELPFRFHGHSTSNGMATLRYKLPGDAFAATRTKDTCFCLKSSPGDAYAPRVCPPIGVLNISKCNIESPLLTSFPHFYSGDESLLEQVDGLDPRRERHETYFDLHPRFGVPLSGRSRFQVNLEVRTATAMPFTGPLKDGAILPLIWIDVGADDIPDPLLSILQDAHFVTNAIEAVCQWGSLVAAAVSVTALLLTLKKRQNERHRTLQRNISGQDKLLEHESNGNV